VKPPLVSNALASDESEGAIGRNLGIGAKARCDGLRGLRGRRGKGLSVVPPLARLEMDGLRPGGHIIGAGGPARDEVRAAGVAPFPKRESSLAHEVLVVQAQFFEARAGNVGQFHFDFLRGGAGDATLGDVLDPGTRGLDHLVAGPTVPANVAFTEPHRDVVNQARHLEALQLPVAAVFGDQRLPFGHCQSSSTQSTMSIVSTNLPRRQAPVNSASAPRI